MAEVLGQMRDQVRERRLMMYQYFKDYDRVSAVIVSDKFDEMNFSC